MARVYIVVGTSADEDDKNVWPVAAYLKRGSAKGRLTRLRRWVDANTARGKAVITLKGLREGNPFDPDMVQNLWSLGIPEYDIWEIELTEKLKGRR